MVVDVSQHLKSRVMGMSGRSDKAELSKLVVSAEAGRTRAEEATLMRNAGYVGMGTANTRIEKTVPLTIDAMDEILKHPVVKFDATIGKWVQNNLYAAVKHLAPGACLKEEYVDVINGAMVKQDTLETRRDRMPLEQQDEVRGYALMLIVQARDDYVPSTCAKLTPEQVGEKIKTLGKKYHGVAEYFTKAGVNGMFLVDNAISSEELDEISNDLAAEHRLGALNKKVLLNFLSQMATQKVMLCDVGILISYTSFQYQRGMVTLPQMFRPLPFEELKCIVHGQLVYESAKQVLAPDVPQIHALPLPSKPTAISGTLTPGSDESADLRENVGLAAGRED